MINYKKKGEEGICLDSNDRFGFKDNKNNISH